MANVQRRDIRLARVQNSAVSEHTKEQDTYVFFTRLKLLIMTLTGTLFG